MSDKTTSTEWMDRVRVALSECGETHYEVSRATGIRVSRLYDFANRKKSLGAANFEILAKYLGFRLVGDDS